MQPSDPTWIALIRGIGPTTHKVMPMADLRAACTRAGLGDVSTMLATGNVIFTSALSKDALAEVFRGIISDFGLSNEVFLRRPSDLQRIIDTNPMPSAAQARPNHLLVLFVHNAPGLDDASALSNHGGPEPVLTIGQEIYIDYCEGVGSSKLTPEKLLRILRQPGTARNWNTVGKLAAKTR